MSLDGQTILTTPAMELQHHGPVVQVVVTLAESVSKQLIQQNIDLPGSLTGHALIDTGESVTCIDERAAQQLRLPIIDVVHFTSHSSGDQVYNVYPVKFEIPGSTIRGDVPRARGIDLDSNGLLMLIGRDILASCTLHYNGASGAFTLTI